MNKLKFKLVILVFLCISLVGCSKETSNAAETTNSTLSTTVTAANNLSINEDGTFGNYSDEEKDSSFDEDSVTSVALSDTGVTITGEGAKESDGTVTISSSGTYVFSGKISDGQIVVNATNQDLVKIVLNGVDITSSSSAPIYVKQADRAIITLAKDSTNILSDSSEYVYDDASSEEPNATIFSKDDLVMNGEGSLEINGNFKNGISSKDDLTITGGIYDITAVNHGFRGKDSVSILDGKFTINAGSDGIQADNTTDTTKGWIAIDGGTYDIKSSKDAIQAETDLNISNGDFTLYTGGGSASVTTNNNEFMQDRNSNTSSSEETTSESYKGLKAGSNIQINDGNFTIDTEDDSLHSNGNILINNGDFTLSTGDDGIHADDTLDITDGSIKITKSFEGIEGAFINVSGGTIDITSSDDGVNAGGGNDGSTQMGPGGQRDNFKPGSNSSDTSSYEINITGGNLTVDTSGDGIDSNGNLIIDEGIIIVNGPTGNGNTALDFDGELNVNGGTLIAAGSSDMLESISESSSQASLTVVFSSKQKAGDLVNVSTGDGSEVITFAPSKDYQSIIVSSPNLTKGETYSISSGGSHSGTITNGLYTGGEYSDGNILTDVTLSSIVTSISDDGSEFTGAMGGGNMPSK